MSTLSIAQLLQQNEGYINAEVGAVCQSITQKTANKTGRPFWVCKLGDATGPDSVECATFTAPRFKQGDRIHLAGQGLKLTRNNFGTKLAVSDKTIITVVGQSVHEPEQAERRANGEPAINGQLNPIPGQTVGLAIKEAVGILTNGLTYSDTIKVISTPTFWHDLHEVASDLIRVSRMLEAGKLAQPINQRTKAPQRALIPQPDAIPGLEEEPPPF